MTEKAFLSFKREARSGLIELVGKSIKNGGVGSSTDGGVDNSEGDRTIVVDKDFEADREAGISFP